MNALITTAFFHGLRSAERLVPPFLFAYALWPAVAAFAFYCTAVQAGHPRRSDPAEPYGRRPGFRHRWRTCIDETYGRLATLWPDRFDAPAWRKRFVVAGLEQLLACSAAGKPIVLAVIHAPHLNVLRLFLRRQGLPVATLMYSPNVTVVRRLINAAADQRSSLSGTPHSFSLGQLRSSYAFLRSGHCLLIACDKPSEDAIEVHTPLGGLRVHVGPFRLAAIANASVVPAVIWQERPWQFQVDLGQPMTVPPLASDLAAFAPLARHCVATWQFLFVNRPEHIHFFPGAWNRLTPPVEAG